MVRKSVVKAMPSRSVAKPIAVEWVVVEIVEGVHLMQPGTRYGRMRQSGGASGKPMRGHVTRGLPPGGADKMVASEMVASEMVASEGVAMDMPGAPAPKRSVREAHSPKTMASKSHAAKMRPARAHSAIVHATADVPTADVSPETRLRGVRPQAKRAETERDQEAFGKSVTHVCSSTINRRFPGRCRVGAC